MELEEAEDRCFLAWTFLLDPRSDFYAMHPELKPMELFCLLRVASKELNALAWKAVQECWDKMGLHRMGSTLPPGSTCLSLMQVELDLLRYIQRFTCSDDRVVAGSFPLYRLLQELGAAGQWKPGDIDVMTRGVEEADRAKADTVDFFAKQGYMVEVKQQVATESGYAFAGLEWSHEMGQGQEWHMQVGRAELQGAIRSWLDEKRDDLFYAPIMRQLDQA